MAPQDAVDMRIADTAAADELEAVAAKLYGQHDNNSKAGWDGAAARYWDAAQLVRQAAARIRGEIGA